MTQSLHPLRREADAPFAASAPAQIALISAIIAAMSLGLAIMGRPLVCPCGTVELWQGASDTSGNSQQFADWYSFLHAIFGLGLFVFVNRLKPGWRLGAKAVVATASSAVWEAFENMPFIVALFNPPQGMAAYSGDSILNAFGDTLFVLLGFLLAARLPLWAVGLLAAGLELLVSFTIGDGLLLGTLRILGADV